MRKYWAFFRANIQNTLTYRGPIFVWLISNILVLATIVAVWLSSSAGQAIGGYTKPELISYYVTALFLQWLTGWFPFYGIVDEIKHGTIILTSLLKPFSFFWRKFAEELGWHTVSSIIGLVASLIIALALKRYIVFSFFPERILLSIMAIILAIFVVFSMSLCLGLLAFWFTEVSAVDSLFWAGRTILGGQGIPISFIPGIFQTVVRILPFRYMFSFPLEIYFGKLTGSEIIQGIVMQIIWTMAFVWIYRLMWERGRKVYAAFGQ